MKLEECVKPVRFKPDFPILVKDVLAHLLLLSNEANAGREKKTVVADLHRQVAIDFLALYNVTNPSEIRRIASNVVR